MIKTLLVDDEQLVRSGFTMMLSTEPEIAVVGEAPDGAEGVRLATSLAPDVILMDVSMPIMDGIEATRRIVADTDCKVIILTTFDNEGFLFDALLAGASGFLLKNSEPEALVRAILATGNGQALLAPEVTMRVIQECVSSRETTPSNAGTDTAEKERPPGLEYLTAREREVLLLLAKGLSNAEIGQELFVSEATVKTHVSNCLSKLHLRDRVQAVILVYEAGLIQR